MTSLSVLEPDWPAPPGVRAAFTLRTGGVSAGAYASLNLGSKLGDDALAVAENRRRVAAELGLPAEPLWLSQVHGTTVVEADGQVSSAQGAGAPAPQADAAVMTAAAITTSSQPWRWPTAALTPNS